MFPKWQLRGSQESNGSKLSRTMIANMRRSSVVAAHIPGICSLEKLSFAFGAVVKAAGDLRYSRIRCLHIIIF